MKHAVYVRFLLGVLLSGIATTASAQVVFRASFEGSTPYEFDNQYPLEGNYTIEHRPTGGWNGTGGAHITQIQGRTQYNMGWYVQSTGFTTWRTGDVAYFRFRVRYDDNFRWDGSSSMQNKMVDFGLGPNGGRVILHQERPHASTYCGVSPTTYDTRYGTLAVKQGVNPPCTPSTIITYGVWYHVQVAVRSSSTGNGYFKLWVNNHDVNNPTTQVLNFNLPTTDWNDSWVFGGFMTNPSPRNQGFTVDDFEVARSFDPGWFAGGGGGTTPPPPTQPPPSSPPPPPTSGGPNGLPWSARFETNNFTEFNGGATSGLTVINTSCFSGRCARAPLTSGTLSENYADFLFGDHTLADGQKVEEAYLQLYSKFDPGYVWPSSSQKIALFNLTDGAGARKYQVYVYVNRNGQYDITHSKIDTWQFWGLSQNQGSPVSVRFGQWDKLKMRVRLNTPGQANGIVQLWVNNVLKASYSNVNIREGTSLGLNKMIMGSYATDVSGSNGTQYWDEVSVTTTDPLDPDDAPSAPTNLRLISSN